MFNYTGEKCSVCEEKFTKEDDVVVCPECGAPYHRECYLKQGHCTFEKKHAQGFEFKLTKETGGKNRCANCGTDNAQGNLNCEHCGSPMPSEEEKTAKAQENTQSNAQGTVRVQPNLHTDQSNLNQFSPLGIADPALNQMFTNNIMKRKYDDISADDWTKFIGKSAPLYLFQFYKMDDTKRKTSISWAALFFAPLYFLYRKMWFWAFLSLFGTALSNIPSVISIFQSLGLEIFSNISAQTLMLLSTVCSFLSIGMSIYFGLYAFHLYRQHAAKIIKQLQSREKTVDSYHEKLTKTGAPSVVAVVAVCASLLALTYGFVFYVGPENILALYNMYY